MSLIVVTLQTNRDGHGVAVQLNAEPPLKGEGEDLDPAEIAAITMLNAVDDIATVTEAEHA